MQKILVVDDDQDICLMLTKFLTKHLYVVHTAFTGEEALLQLRANHFDLILCDFKLPDLTGVELLQKIKVLNAHVAVIIITGYSDVKTAVETFRFGASDYITKPLYPDELLASIQETIAKNLLKNNQSSAAAISLENKKVTVDASHSGNFIVGKSESSQSVQRFIELIAPSDISVIITGETGTGKELIAKAIHYNSGQQKAPFVAVNLGAVPHELAESELFGHEKG
ncbi:MAG: sigma-54-dependent transcriptional regulator, partial [Cyclobacteriaceae bacterium]